MIDAFVQLFKFVKKHKKWWLIPLLGLMFLLGILIVYAHSTAISPFVYIFY